MSWKDVYDSCKFNDSNIIYGCLKKGEINPYEDCKECDLFIDEVAEERNS